jgi:YesN/AraC family two-component response regulator
MFDNFEFKKQTTKEGLGLSVCSLEELLQTSFWFSSYLQDHYDDLSTYDLKENQFITLVVKECLVFIVFDNNNERLCIGPMLIKSVEETQVLLSLSDINLFNDLRHVSMSQVKAIGSLVMSYWTDKNMQFQQLPLYTIKSSEDTSTNPSSSLSVYLDEEIIQKMNSLMATGNIDDMQGFLKYFDTVNLDKIISKDSLRATKNNVIASISRYSFIAINEGLDYLGMMKEADEFIYRVESYDNVKSCILLLKESAIRYTTLIQDFKHGDYSKYTKYVIKKIKNDYSQNLTLAGLALELNISSSHLSRILSNETKLSFNDLLNSERIEQAKEYLKHPSNNVAAVAHLCGFTYQNHFTQVFKKHTGMTPSEYLRSMSPILKQGLST